METELMCIAKLQEEWDPGIFEMAEWRVAMILGLSLSITGLCFRLNSGFLLSCHMALPSTLEQSFQPFFSYIFLALPSEKEKIALNVVK